MSAPLTYDNRQALSREIKHVQADATALVAEAEAWAAEVPDHAGGTIALLQRGLVLRQALARLSRRLALICAEPLAEEGMRGDRLARRTLAQLLLFTRRVSCVRCRVPTSFDPEGRRRPAQRDGHRGRGYGP